jgi:hypothetical protein
VAEDGIQIYQDGSMNTGIVYGLYNRFPEVFANFTVLNLVRAGYIPHIYQTGRAIDSIEWISGREVELVVKKWN